MSETGNDSAQPVLSIRERLSPPSKRGFEYYLRHTNLLPNDFEGKKIVNIAAGGDDLNKYLEQQTVKPEIVVNIDINYPRKFLGMQMTTPENAVRGNALALPIANETMDIVVSSEGISRWLPKDRQAQAGIEAVRVLKPGGVGYFFEFRQDMSMDPYEFIRQVRMAHPNISAEYDQKTKTVKLTKEDSYQPFSTETIPNPKEMFEQITDTDFREKIAQIVKLLQGDVDQLNIDPDLLTIIKAMYTKNLRGGSVTEDDWETAKHLLVACVDAGEEIGNNSVFSRARSLVSDKSILHPEDGIGVNPDSRSLEFITKDFDHDLASTDTKLRALLEASSLPTWAGQADNRRILDQISKSGNPDAWKLATITLRKNVFQLTTQERKKIETFFGSLLKKAQSSDATESQPAIYLLEQFRALSWGFKTDPLTSAFARMHDPSVYGTAEYWSAQRQKGPIEAMVGIFDRNRHGKKVYAGKEVLADYNNDATPIEFARQLIRISRTSPDKLKVEQIAARIKCPGCYGYSAGFEAQQIIQDGEFQFTKEPQKVRKNEFAALLTVLNYEQRTI